MFKKEKNDWTLLFKMMEDNKNLKPGQFVKKAMEKELFSKNFAKSTIYNYFIGYKRYLKDRTVYKLLCKDFVKIMLNSFETKANTNIIKQKETTLEDELTKLDIKVQNFTNKYMNIIEENRSKIFRLEQMNGQISKYLEEETIKFEIEKSEIYKKYIERM